VYLYFQLNNYILCNVVLGRQYTFFSEFWAGPVMKIVPRFSACFPGEWDDIFSIDWTTRRIWNTAEAGQCSRHYCGCANVPINSVCHVLIRSCVITYSAGKNKSTPPKPCHIPCTIIPRRNCSGRYDVKTASFIRRYVYAKCACC